MNYHWKVLTKLKKKQISNFYVWFYVSKNSCSLNSRALRLDCQGRARYPGTWTDKMHILNVNLNTSFLQLVKQKLNHHSILCYNVYFSTWLLTPSQTLPSPFTNITWTRPHFWDWCHGACSRLRDSLKTNISASS